MSNLYNVSDLKIQYNDLCKNIKIIRDIIHGNISISVFAISLIDTKSFQRLRHLRQLGTCYFVFPNAVHTRFEHSIGTYYIAGKLLNTINNTTNITSISSYLKCIPELNNYYDRMYSKLLFPLDNYVCELVKIAALCHDIGHGPFSHVFDDHFIPLTNKSNSKYATHEERSGLILETLIKNNFYLNGLIHDDEIQFIKNLINPQKEHTGFIYQIVSNYLNGLDVDKFDYLVRDIQMINFDAKVNFSRLTDHILVIDNNIVYSEQSVDDIFNLFHTRYRLHKQIYCHKAVIAVQFIIVELLSLLNNILNISDSIDNINSFDNLTDDYIIESIKVINTFKSFLSAEQYANFEKAQILIDNLEKRNLYTVIFSTITNKKINLTEIIPFEYINDILVLQNKIGFVSGSKPNPFDAIFVYKTKDATKIAGNISAFKKDKDDITSLMPKLYQEYVITIYYKHKHNLHIINKLKDYFSHFWKLHNIDL